jgi:hypothetical protein
VSHRYEDPYTAYGENVVLRDRHHPAALLPSFLVTIGVIVAAAAIGGVVSPNTGNDLIDTVAGLVMLAFVFRFLWHALEWWKARIVVTDRRIYEVTGIFNRNVASMPLWKVTDMTYRRTIWGYLFRYGAMALESAGHDQALGHINYLRHPDHFYKTVTARAGGKPPFSAPGNSPSAPPPSAPPPSAPADVDDTGELPPVVY